jgi:serine/threonine protein kinase
MSSDHRPIGGAMIGQSIGSYRIESWLGAGSLSIVYRGVHETTCLPVAIKVARGGKHRAPYRVEHAGEILSRLHHPNIVGLLAMGRFRGATYLAMEYISGLTLEQILARHGAMPWPLVVGLGLQICAALHEMHERGVLHCNLKPSHLILTEKSQLKLIGFGLAKSPDKTALVTNGLARGTPGYMAPEQICDTSAICHRTDLYALGVVLWHLLTGEEPFQELWESGYARSGATLAFAHLTQPPTRPSGRIQGIPAGLDNLVIQLMAKAPRERPRDATQVARVLSRLRGKAVREPINEGLPVARARRLLRCLPSWFPDSWQPWTGRWLRARMSRRKTRDDSPLESPNALMWDRDLDG